MTGRRQIACRRPAATAPSETHVYEGHFVAKNKILCYGFLFAGLSGPPGLGPDDGDEAWVDRGMERARQKSMVGRARGGYEVPCLRASGRGGWSYFLIVWMFVCSWFCIVSHWVLFFFSVRS